MKMTWMKSWGAAALVAACATPAFADLTFGGSKAAGMGGAGLALGADPLGPGARNPAYYGLHKKSAVRWPQLKFSLRGVGYGDLDEFFDVGNGSGLDENNLGKVARSFGDERVEFGAGLGFGFQFGGFALDLRGEAFGITDPNPSLKSWVNSGANLALLPTDAVLDGYGLGTVELGLSAGELIPAGPDKLAVGGRFKIVRGYYSHFIANSAAIQAGKGSVRGPEMGSDDILSETGVGLDAGVHWASSKVPGLTGAFLINNLLAPNLSFDARTQNGGGTSVVKPFKRSLDLGVAFDKGPWIAALDIIDLGGGAGMQELRLGGEVHAGRWVAVRAGYGSRNGMTLGVGLGGFNIAYSGTLPLQASYAIKF